MSRATSVLSDGTITRLVSEGHISIEPWDPSLVQPASVDLRLGTSFRVFHNHRAAAIDLKDPPRDLTEHVEIEGDQPFVIHPGEFVLGRTLEQVAIPTDIVARIEGKALALDTEVPTPSGWRSMGDVEVGDEVFDANGLPTRIVAATDPMVGRPCREVEFSDGTTVVADLWHQWEVTTKYDRRRGARRVVTTADLERSLKCGQENNFHVDPAPPVQYPVRDLAIDPYVLGAWIGDGTATTADITSADDFILHEIEAAGVSISKAAGPYRYRMGRAPRVRDPRTGRYTGNDSLHTRLRHWGLLGDKRVPAGYLQASVDQRQALLEGLMDTDGYVDKLGRCDITTRRQKTEGRFKRSRAVVAVRPVESVPVRCIQVASPRGVFLVTRSYIPTHNSSLGRLGLIVHATAGFVDPGFTGTLTLEITNLTRVPIKLYAGKPIAQLSFMTLDAPAERPYGSRELGSHYQGQVEATESRYGAPPGGDED
jgi:deoxycytidine triphosphate deaminase